MRAAFVLVLAATAALAQEPAPSVSVFPLGVGRVPSGFSKADTEALQKDFVRGVRRAGALVPDSATLELAIKELKRSDCDREDACLQALALKSATLYALYGSIEYTLEGAVVASGRIVRDDGQLVAGPAKVSMPKSSDAFRDVARVALTRLLEQLELKKLPIARPVVGVTPPAETQPPAKVTPPQSTPPEVTKPGSPVMRLSGMTMAGIGAAAAIAGVVVFATTNVPTKDANGNIPPEDVGRVGAVQAQQAAGVALMIGGAVVGGLGGVLWGLSGASSSQTVKSVSFVPVAGGAVAVLGGSF